MIELDKASNGVATVTLNRPEKHNAFNEQIIQNLTQVFTEINADDSVRVMVLSAQGKNFSAGADLDWMKRMASYSVDDNLRDARVLAEMLRILNSLKKPTIARIQGAAFGGGVGLISCCDIAIAADTASFCLSEVKIGLIPATISPYVIEAIGERAARRYFLSAERFSAQRAASIGLVSEVCDEHALDEVVQSLSEKIMANSPAAVSAAKLLIADVAKRPISAELIEETSKRIAAIRTSDEGQEGLSAFLEKRSPAWLGSTKERH